MTQGPPRGPSFEGPGEREDPPISPSSTGPGRPDDPPQPPTGYYGRPTGPRTPAPGPGPGPAGPPPQGYPQPSPYPFQAHMAPEAAPPPPPSGGSYWLGILLTFAMIGGYFALAGRFELGNQAPTAAFILWIIAAVALTAFPRTRRTGAGMFIAGGLVPVLIAGACVLFFIGAIQATGG